MMAAKRRRKHAEDRALEILMQDRPITDADLLEVLARWRFKKKKGASERSARGGRIGLLRYIGIGN